MALGDFDIVRRSLTSRLLSTATTVLMVAVAVALLVSLLSLRASGQRSLERGAGNADLLIAAEPGPMNTVLNHLYLVNPPRAAMPWAEYQRVRTSQPWSWTLAMAQGDSFRGFPVIATEHAMLGVYEPIEGRPMALAEGVWFAEGAPGDWQIVLGAEAARRSGVRLGQGVYLTHGVGRRAAVGGDVVDLDDEGNPINASTDFDDGALQVHREYLYEVVGVLEPTGTAFDRALFTNLRSTWIKHAYVDSAEALRDEQRLVTGFLGRVLTRPGQRAGAMLPAVFESIRRDGLTVASPGDQIRRLLSIVGNVDQILVAMAVVVLIASGAGILLALVSSMEQRRRQIAVLRVLGASRGRIFGLVMFEAGLIGLMGAVLGVLVASLALGAVGGVMAERTGLTIDAGLSPRGGLMVVFLAILVAQVAALIPSVMAYRTSVVRSLRPIG
ncbi:MAG: ABC transporter permease [Planctomycetota bacterium]